MSKQTIYDQLIKAGCSPTGALALMGNWECESNCEPCRVQGDFTSDRSKSKSYASRVDNGLVSEEEFMYDQKGWGLAQWTFWSRKRDLLNFCRRNSISIANEEAQVDFALMELQNSYKTLWADLTGCIEEDLYKITELVCKKYEQPAFANVQDRANAAVSIREALKVPAAPEPTPDKDKPETFWPPRMICKGMNGPDVAVWQAVLKARGYTLSGTAGVFGESTDSATRKFQRDHGLDDDGIAGPLSWAENLKY